MKNLEELIIRAFEDRDNINKDTQGEIREAVDVTLNQLDSGTIRVCEKLSLIHISEPTRPY